MDKTTLEKILEHKKNLVLIGEAGSGKTEVGLNLAIYMAQHRDRSVHLFDLDQTKALFRARDAETLLANNDVEVHFLDQYLDTPVVVSGVIESMRDPSRLVILDVGGGSHGSHMIGQFYQYLNTENSQTLYIFNPFRVWSDDRDNIAETMRSVLGSARLRNIRLVANPNLGEETTKEVILDGINKIRTLLPEYPIQFVCVLEHLADEIASMIPEPVLPIRIRTLPDWMQTGFHANDQ